MSGFIFMLILLVLAIIIIGYICTRSNTVGENMTISFMILIISVTSIGIGQNIEIQKKLNEKENVTQSK